MCKLNKTKFVILILCLCILTMVLAVSTSAAPADFVSYIPDRPPTGSVPMELWINDEFANLYRLGASWYGWVEYGISASESIWYKNVTVTFDSDSITINGWNNGVHLSTTFYFSQEAFSWVDYMERPLDHFRLYGNVSPTTWIEQSYNSGYNAGYYEGLEVETFTFSDLASAVVEAPVNTFMQFFQFEVLGVNFAQLAAVCVSLLAVAAVVLFFVRRMK